ncbi:Transferase family, putative [Leishmania lindenbergi]|uniref:Transferase family n=1 Tax=Leishmania lindenbergi TaxID=651832 RepID=A0AAW2ZVW1_9TRYP
MTHLAYYYPQLSGRLVLLPNGESTIGLLDSSTFFVEATCDKTLRELLDEQANTTRCSSGGEHMGNGGKRLPFVLPLFDLPAVAKVLFAPYNPPTEHTVKNPLFTLLRTRFACSGIALGVRISHSLCNAHGLFLIVQHLTELYRKLKTDGGNAAATPVVALGPAVLECPSYSANLRVDATPDELEEALS